MRLSAFGAAVAVLALAVGCASGHGTTVTPTTPTPATTAPTTAPRTAPTSTAPHAATAGFADELVGAWSVSTASTEVAVRFLAGGRYRSIEILSQPRPERTFEFQRQEDGVAKTSGNRLRLRPTTAVTSRTDPGDPTGDYANRPATTAEQDYTWRVSGADPAPHRYGRPHAAARAAAVSGGRLRRWWSALRPTVTSERVLVQLAAVVAGAAFAAVAAVLYSNASGTWQQAVREETQRTAARQEQVRTVYDDEAPVAFAAAAAQVRARELRPLRGTGRLAGSEYTVAAQTAFQLVQSAPPGSLAAARQYALPGGGLDAPPGRLADVTRADPAPPDADATAMDGDAQALAAGVVGLFTVLITGAAVTGAAMPRRGTADDTEPPEIVPQPGLAAGRRRRAAILLLAFWAAGVLLPFAQLALSAEEQRSQGAGARTAVQLSGQIAIGLTRSQFETNALRTAAFADVAATSRELAALDALPRDAATERAVAGAEESAAATARAIAAAMSQVPATVDGLDARTVAELRSGPRRLARNPQEAKRGSGSGEHLRQRLERRRGGHCGPPRTDGGGRSRHVRRTGVIGLPGSRRATSTRRAELTRLRNMAGIRAGAVSVRLHQNVDP